jgi:hypothetical protein
MDAVWQALLASAATLTLLLIIRSAWSTSAKRRVGAIWATIVIASVIGCDTAYPRVQRRSAMSAVLAVGGRITEGNQGIIVDLSGTSCDDAAFKRLALRVKHFANLAEFRLNGTSVTDSSVDVIRKTWESTESLRRIDATDTKITPGALTRLKRSQTNLETVP